MRASQRFCRLEKILASQFGSQRRSISTERRHFKPLADACAVPLDRKCGNAERFAIGIDVIDEAAGTQHMRIIEQIFGTIDRREADVEPVSVAEMSAAFQRFITSATRGMIFARARMRSVVVRSA